jgi:NADH dehydrogenase
MALLSRRFLGRRARPRLLVAGGNFAGLAAARALAGKDVQLTVIDPSPCFEWRPNAHELLSRRKRPEQLRHDRRELLARLGHDFRCDSVSRIDREQQRLHTASGEWLEYDALVLAVGEMSHDHGVPGVHEYAHIPRTVESCTRIGNALTRLAALPGDRNVVVVGAGMEGLEMLGEILRRDNDGGGTPRFVLHLVEMAEQLFPHFPGLHERLVQQLQGRVRLHTGRRVVTVAADGVVLDDGTHVASRLVLWSGGSHAHPLPAAAGLAPAGGDAPVRATLQSRSDDHVFVAGDAAALSPTLGKQAYHALDTGRHAALNAWRLLQGRSLRDFRPRPRPTLMSLGEQDAVMFFGRQALATPLLLPLKEAIYQYGYHQLMPPRSAGDIAGLVRDLRHGADTLAVWRRLRTSGDAALFQAR